MSNRPSAPHADRRPRAPQTSTDRPTATYPTGDHLAHLEAHRERLNDLWADRTPTEELQAVPDRPATRQARPSRARRHLRAALAGVLAAAALLTGLSLYAADGISSARRDALAQRGRGGPASSVTSVNTPQGNSSATQNASSPTSRPVWTVHGTDSPYDRTDPTASPLDLPGCTTSPSTPLPCLATVSPDSRRVVVLEEDASLTGLDRR